MCALRKQLKEEWLKKEAVVEALGDGGVVGGRGVTALCDINRNYSHRDTQDAS